MSSEARKGVSWYHINVSNGESLLSVTVVLDEIDPDGDAAYLFEASGELARRWNKRGAGRGPRGVQRARPRHLICRGLSFGIGSIATNEGWTSKTTHSPVFRKINLLILTASNSNSNRWVYGFLAPACPNLTAGHPRAARFARTPGLRPLVASARGAINEEYFFFNNRRLFR